MNPKRPLVRGLAVAAGVLLAMAVSAGCALESEGGGGPTTENGLTKVKIGYLHTVAVDAHLWLGITDGVFEKHGLDVEPVEFDTGISESQALSGGSLDVAMMGAVISNFPPQAGSTVFLANNVEYDTAQLWTAAGSGIDSVKDLAGKEVLTTAGTTAHVYLHNALKANGVDPESVRILDTDMPSAVTGFISGAAPAVVLWVPFDETVKSKMPDAKLVDSASSYYPEAAILGGWAANRSVYENNREVLEKLAAAWLDINHALVNDPEAITRVHEKAYADHQDLAATKRQFSFEKVFSNDEWAQLYQDGEVGRWIGQVERVFVEVGGLPEFVEPQEFLDTEIFINAYKTWKQGAR